MAFENLQDKLSSVFKKLRGRGRLTENDIKSAMREVRLALLEADVSVKVVRDFIDAVSARALGSDVLESLTPGQQVIKIVNEELTALMGGSNERINMAPKPPQIGRGKQSGDYRTAQRHGHGLHHSRHGRRNGDGRCACRR